MDFWGVEVKSGKPLKVSPDEGYIIHLSQAALGESKSKAESVPLYVTVGEQKLVLGTLSQQNAPQIQFDLVFGAEFELSHNWKHGSIYFAGYKTEAPGVGDPFLSDSDEMETEEEEEAIPAPAPVAAENGKSKKVVENAKSVKIAEPVKETKSEDDDDSEDESDDESEDESDDSDDASDEDEEDTPVPAKAESSKAAGKKRAAESPAKTPQQQKKSKAAATPQKTDGKKGAHTATPHPSKKVAKTAEASPSSAQVSCGSCSKKFNSEKALESHSKAKHSAAK